MFFHQHNTSSRMSGNQTRRGLSRIHDPDRSESHRTTDRRYDLIIDYIFFPVDRFSFRYHLRFASVLKDCTGWFVHPKITPCSPASGTISPALAFLTVS
jgi:hypothetical protein